MPGTGDNITGGQQKQMHPSGQRLREKIKAGQPVIGHLLVEFTGPAVVNVLADAGFDFLIIDCEHGNHNPRDVEAMIEAGWHSDCCVLVRTANEDRGPITRTLDAGAAGVVVPAIESMEQVRQVVRATKYRPIGRRGVHLLRGHTRHRSVEPNRFMNEANQSVLTMIQIELSGAVELADEIAATEGVDGLYVGPGDLSVDLGVAGQWNSPVVIDAIANVVSACKHHGKIAACHANNGADMPRLQRMGIQMFGYSCDIGLFASAARQVTERFHETMSSTGRPRQ